MKVSVEVPDEAKPVMREIMIMYKDDGIDTYQKVCEKAIQWYLTSYVQIRNQAIANRSEKEDL